LEQCAGFVRIKDGDNALDSTAIHPEAYPVVERMAASLNLTPHELVGNREHVTALDLEAFKTETIGPETLQDIRAELLHPGRDPRRRFKAPRLLEGVHSISDLEEGMETEGVVTNVTDFGAFVDIGVDQDGLVHLSELANRYVADPRRFVEVGQVVRVKVIKVDKEAPRISLSMKSVSPPARHKRSAPPPRHDDQAAERRPERTRRGEKDRSSEDSRREHPHSRPPSRKPRDRDRQGVERRMPPPPPRNTGAPPVKSVREFAKPGRSAGNLNTQLAEQLANLKDKLGSNK
ncbi:MAG TPA: S1 RNA-binding domain-containing protein, partial [Candidatus Hydrogenedentes bacterium]|nr:S1 RNA-binding domain-containing protein [Candidatus Hydrogenedentota bacterium]